MKISDALQQAKQEILTRGLAQTGHFKIGGKVCIYGALGEVYKTDPAHILLGRGYPELSSLLRTLAENKIGLRSVSYFNDNVNSVNEVLDFLDEATLIAKEQGL